MKDTTAFHSITVPTNITSDQVIDLLICACEGGSNYWCEAISPLPTDRKHQKEESSYAYMLRGFVCTEMCESSEKLVKHTVTADDVKGALDLMVKEYSQHFADLLNENTDAETGDVFLQLCVFKDVIYG